MRFVPLAAASAWMPSLPSPCWHMTLHAASDAAPPSQSWLTVQHQASSTASCLRERFAAACAAGSDSGRAHVSCLQMRAAFAGYVKAGVLGVEELLCLVRSQSHLASCNKHWAAVSSLSAAGPQPHTGNVV